MTSLKNCRHYVYYTLTVIRITVILLLPTVRSANSYICVNAYVTIAT